MADEAVPGEHSQQCEIGSVEMPHSEWLFSAAASFQQSYGQVHPYLAAVLCIVGTLMNGVTVLVLTRPTMRSPVNVLLCAVAICDIVVMSSYLVFVVHFLLAAASRCEPSDFSYGWAWFMMFHAHASVIFHAASIWMTVSLAQIRVLTIRRATAGPSSTPITERFTALLAVLTCLLMVLVNVPNFLTFEIMEVPSSAMLPCLQPLPSEAETPVSDFGTAANPTTLSLALVELALNATTQATGEHNGTSTERQRRHHRLRVHRRDVEAVLMEEATPILDESLVYTVRAHDSDCMKLKLAFWSNGMIFKVIPCLMLTLSIWALLHIIAEVAHKRKNLAQVMRKKVPKDHTTPMLAAVLLIFLLAELPQGLFLVLNGIFSAETFHKRVYLPLGDLMDLLSLLNSAVGFLIYVGMSRKFRTVFLQLLFDALGCMFSKARVPPEQDGKGPNGGGADERWRRSSASAMFTGQSRWEREEKSRGTDTGSSWGARRLIGGGGTGKRRLRAQGWMRWRRMSRGGGTAETTKTEQLSMCPSSLLGLPPLTLAFSCSAGLTAAAASVGTQLLSLDASPPSRKTSNNNNNIAHSPGSNRMSASVSSTMLLVPHTLPLNRRRPSAESTTSSNRLEVPGGRKRPSILLPPPPPYQKRASSHSLNVPNGRSTKRISFNLPSGEGKETDRMERRGTVGESRIRRSLIGMVQQRRATTTTNCRKRAEAKSTLDSRTKEQQVIANGTPHREEDNCAVEALLKMRNKRASPKCEGRLTRVMMGRWAKGAEGKMEKSAKKGKGVMVVNQTGSSSPRRRMLALGAETHFVGGWTYC